MFFSFRVLIASAFLPFAAGAKGISVRFLASPPEDSIVSYSIYRSESADGPSVAVGKIPALPSKDTLSYPDTSAGKGKSYYYSIRAVNAGGVESDPSEQTRIGYPVLSLPDTLKSSGAQKGTTLSLPASVDPLQGSTPLTVGLKDSSRFLVAFDLATRTLTFRSRSGKADTGTVITSAQYYGKFEDKDTLVIMVAEASGSPIGKNPREFPKALAFPGIHSLPSQGAMAIRNLPGPGRLEVLTLLGARVVSRSILTPKDLFLWDGTDDAGALLKPARYLMVFRDVAGSVRDAGPFTLIP